MEGSILFVSPVVIQHGIIWLEAETMRLKVIQDACGEEWPPDFDPNDISMFESVLSELHTNSEYGYDEYNFYDKPFRFFIALIPEYVRAHFHVLTDEVRSALFRFYSETRIRICLHWIKTDSQSSPSFVDAQILELGSAILEFPRFTDQESG
jgi:hypothetical protein